jgi:YggT family protein
MYEALSALAALTAGMRPVLLAGGVAMAAIATADWAARTRRINPFGGVARFLRAQVDPRLTGIERQVTRAGGHPSATPWWALAAYVLIAALLLQAMEVMFGLVRDVSVATTLGTGGIVTLLVHWIFRFLSFALIVRVIASWFPSAAHSIWMRWSFSATEWLLRPLRRVIPNVGMIDITPIVAWFALQIAEWLVTGILHSTF